MNLKDYFYETFWQNVKLLPVSKPNATILRNPSTFFLHEGAVFFGSKDWETYNSDILNIPKETRDNFVLSLFVISTIDYFVKNNISLHKSIRPIYDPPKLGWCGYGPHFEHPFIIIKRHYVSDVLESDIMDRKEEIQDLFKAIISEYNGLNYDEFLYKIKNNQTEIPDEFNAPGFFEFLNDLEQKEWIDLMSKILN